MQACQQETQLRTAGGLSVKDITDEVQEAVVASGIKDAAGKTATLQLTIARAGRYSCLCTLPGHAAADMKGVLTVK